MNLTLEEVFEAYYECRKTKREVTQGKMTAKKHMDVLLCLIAQVFVKKLAVKY